MMRIAPATLILAIALALAASVGSARAAGTAASPANGQAAAPVKSPTDSTLIRRQVAQAPSSDASSDADHPRGLDWPRVAAALAAVIGLILLLRWGGQRLFNTPLAQGSTRAVQVLSRSVLAPRQHILLVQVGKRVLVVGDCGTQMSPLCEISDADEVASLIGQIRSEKTVAAVRPFGSLFGRAREQIVTDEDTELTADGVDAELPDGPQDEEAALATTRNELSGLAEKIRLVSRQLKT
jgi:flagellar biogenesis protein FliO